MGKEGKAMEKKMNKKVRLENSVQAYGCVCWCGCTCSCGIFTNKNDKDYSNAESALDKTSSATKANN